ncbi:MAG: cation diffusion facilitator family transporter [Desulfohalobium sp.]
MAQRQAETTTDSPEAQHRIWGSQRFRVIAVSLLVGAVLMVVKFAAYFVTGSAGILSDALESIINVAASGFALYSVVLSRRPPDRSHPYGHGKIEYFSAGFEGALIVLAAVAIFTQAVPRFFDPQPLHNLNFGVALVGFAGAVNGVLAGLLIRVGRNSHSLALEADGKHLLTDVVTSVGVIGSLFLVRWTGALWLDPLVACLVAVNILVTGAKLLRESVGRLMDKADPELLQQIVDILNSHRQVDWISLHQLRARRYGPRVHIDLHMVLPRYYDLEQSHRRAEEIEGLLHEAFGAEAEIIVHTDPCTARWCPVCAQENCALRSAALESQARPPFTVSDAMAMHGHHEGAGNG